jgi:hypothetical protein
MSSSIRKNKITLTRGDTLRVKVNIIKNGELYIPVDGDRVRFALKHPELLPDGSDYKDPEPIIEKDIPITNMVLELQPTDTKPLAFGTYEYDVEITFKDGTVDTFITAAPFVLSKEVH